MTEQQAGNGSLPDEEELRRHGLEILWTCTAELIELAKGANLSLATASIHSIGQIGDERALDTLFSLLDNDDLAEVAVVALSKINHPQVANRLLALLSASVPKVTAACAGVLWRFAGKEVVDKLAPLVKAPYTQVRKAAISSLGHMGMADVLTPLFDALTDSDEEIVIASLKTLRSIKVTDPDQLILKLSALYDAIDNPKIRATVVQAFTSIGGPEMLGLAKKALRDPNPRVRANAVELIGAMPIQDKLKVVILRPLDQDGENNRVRGNVAIALGKADPQTAIQILSKMLNSVEKWERASAVYAARFIQSDRVTSWLTTQFTSESDPDVLRNIIESLSYLPGSEVTACFIRALSHDNALIRIGAAKSLGRIGDIVAEEHLLRLLDRETDAGVISEVVTALGRIADSSRIPAIARFLQHTDLRVQANTIEALSAIGTVEIIPHVEPFLNSSDNRIKANAAVACWACGSLHVVEVLNRMLDNPNLKQKSSAIYAIGEIGGALASLQNVRRYLLLISALREEHRRHAQAVADSAPRVRPPAGSSPPPSQAAVPPPTEPTVEDGRASAQVRVPVAELEEAFTRISEGQIDEARRGLEGALAGEPKNPYLLFAMADVYRRMGSVGKACDAFGGLHAIDPHFINSHLLMASLHNKAQEIPQSLAEYFMALKVQLSLIVGQIELGLTMLKEKRSSEASLLLKGLVGQFAIDSRLHFKAGKEYLRNRQADLGLDHLVKAYLVTPSDQDVLLKLAIALLETGRLAEAKQLGGRLLDLCRTNPELASQADKLMALITKRRGAG